MPPPGNTTTGKVLEDTIIPALTRGRYEFTPQKVLGHPRLGGGRHKVDAEVKDPRTGEMFLVSLKWQQTSGTAEQKIPFEVMSLAHAIANCGGRYKRAFLVLGGTKKFRLKDFYTNGGVRDWLRGCEAVTIIDWNEFVARANDGKL